MIVLENDETGAQTEKHQKRMMGEIAKLVGKSEKGTGYLDPAAYDRTVEDPDGRRLRSRHQQSAGRRLDPRCLGEGDGAVGGVEGTHLTEALRAPPPSSGSL